MDPFVVEQIEAQAELKKSTKPHESSFVVREGITDDARAPHLVTLRTTLENPDLKQRFRGFFKIYDLGDFSPRFPQLLQRLAGAPSDR